MKAKTYAALQKTYDQCYLTKSTALYYESLENEAEALRCWRECLFQLQGYNSYSHRARSDAEKELLRSLKNLKEQCEYRAGLLEEILLSKKEAGAAKPKLKRDTSSKGVMLSLRDRAMLDGATAGSSPPAASLAPPPLSERSNSSPSCPTRPSPPRGPGSSPGPYPASTPPRATPPKTARSTSPDKGSGLLSTLRPARKPKVRNGLPDTLRDGGPGAATKAATLAWGSINRAQGAGVSQTFALSSADDQSASPPSDAPYPSSDPIPRRPRSVSQQTRAPSNPSSRPRSGSARADSRRLSSVFHRDGHAAQCSAPPYPTTQCPPIQYADDRPPTPPPHRTPVSRRPSSSQRASPAELDAQRSPESCLNTTRQSTVPQKPPPPPPPKPTKLANARPYDGDDGGVPIPPDYPYPVPEASAKYERLRRKGSSRSRRRRKSNVSASDDSERSGDQEEDDDPAGWAWKKRITEALKTLDKGVDAEAAKQVANEIVVKGDDVRWDDIAGLEIAKLALKEAVVYPFLRPDLFSGLREPARGMLLFGPPGTGKTMLARAVATESKSTFFSISASSLTSKYLGESEKLVRALFAMAKALAPSIIFVDEIDSLLSSRNGSGEHEATRRIKTEFLIQWSDLARAAAGKETSAIGDASRVLVLAATNLPWAIDAAARRRFVRRQYIPLPEDQTREKQLRNLMSHQTHALDEGDMGRLVDLTEGFSGSDITALAKDAAMGPLRSLGEALLHMRMDEIRPIEMQDFERSLLSIRPSVSKEGLKAFEDWAQQYGERVS